MHFTTFFFLMLVHADRTSSSWLTWVRPISFRARAALKLALYCENTSSIGLYLKRYRLRYDRWTYSGEYGTLKIQRKPSRCISFFDFLEV